MLIKSWCLDVHFIDFINVNWLFIVLSIIDTSILFIPMNVSGSHMSDHSVASCPIRMCIDPSLISSCIQKILVPIGGPSELWLLKSLILTILIHYQMSPNSSCDSGDWLHNIHILNVFNLTGSTLVWFTSNTHIACHIIKIASSIISVLSNRSSHSSIIID